MKLTKQRLKQLIKQELNEVGGLGRAMGGEKRYNSLEEGVLALIRNWNPGTPEGQRYLEELEAVSAQFQGSPEREPVTLRDPRGQLAFEGDKK
tara:strand:+ start:383 stop:661 length:279 start_codon:yes stop_codon:yes gene_type:complete